MTTRKKPPSVLKTGVKRKAQVKRLKGDLIPADDENKSHVSVKPVMNDSPLVFEHFAELLNTHKDVMKDFVPRKLDKAVRILYIDIETSPILAMTWGVFNQFIQPNQIVHPSSILCYAAQWEGERKIGVLKKSRRS